MNFYLFKTLKHLGIKILQITCPILTNNYRFPSIIW